jgi:RNA polymerase sigma factor (sigma-70 family)
MGLLRKEFTKVLDLQEIEDAVSQASVRVWRSGSRYDPERGSLGAWMYVIARNCARRMLEAKRRHAALSFVDDLDSATASSSEAAVVAEDPAVPKDRFLQDVRACIADLPPQQRAVLLADFSAGGAAPAETLAAQLGTSRNSIYVSRTNGRKALRAAMVKLGHSFNPEDASALEGWS